MAGIPINRCVCEDDLFPYDFVEQIELLIKSLKDEPLGIIITGRSETGKSELIEALLGIKKEVETSTSDDSDDSDDSDSDSDNSTLSANIRHGIDEKKFKKDGIEVLIWDCPGLQDGTSNEESYMKDLKEKCGNRADLMLYCIDMSQPRFADEFADHDSAVDKLTRAFGHDIWRHSLVVLTKANIFNCGLETSTPHLSDEKEFSAVIEKLFNSRIQDWKSRFIEALEKADVPKSIIQNVEVQPAGYYTEPSLPGREHWLSNLWSYVLTTPDPDAQAKIMLLNVSRLQETVPDQECRGSLQQSIIITEEVSNAIGGVRPNEVMAANQSDSSLREPAQQPQVQEPSVKPSVQQQKKENTTEFDTSSPIISLSNAIGKLLGIGAGIGLRLVSFFLKDRAIKASDKLTSSNPKKKVDLRGKFKQSSSL